MARLLELSRRALRLATLAAVSAVAWPVVGCSTRPPLPPADPPAQLNQSEEDSLRIRVSKVSRNPTLSDVPLLRSALEAPDPDVRRLAAHGLAIVGSPEVLPELYLLSLQDADARVRLEARNGLRAYPASMVERVARDYDPELQRRTEETRIALNRRGEREERRLGRLAPPVEESQMIAWADDLSGDVGLWVENRQITLVKDHAPVGHPLGYNGEANAGELLEYRLVVTNSSLEARRSSSAFCYTYDPYVKVVNRELHLPVLAPGETAEVPDTLMILVAPDAPVEHRAQLFLEVGDSVLDEGREGRPVYREFWLEFTNPGLARVEFSFTRLDDDSWGQSDGNGDGRVDWGEQVEVTVEVHNFGSDTMRDVSVSLTSHSSLAEVIPPVSPAARVIPPGGRAPLRVTWSVRLASGYSGAFQIPLELELKVPHERKQTDEERRRYLNSRGQNAGLPVGYFKWHQDAVLNVGTDRGAVRVGQPRTFSPFDFDGLVNLFVLSDDDDAQMDFLTDAEDAFVDDRDEMLFGE